MSTMIKHFQGVFVASLLCAMACGPVIAQFAKYHTHEFKRQQLTDIYYSEGIATGDLNNDGHMDVVYGPYWFAGPDFKVKREIFPAKPQNREKYANHFFAWVYDFNGDKRPDVFTVSFPGTPAYVYENPGPDELNNNKPWKKHEVFDWVSNESPHFVNLVGDERPELVCTRGGYYGYATIDWNKPFEYWTFHIVSEKKAAMRFGHGLGVGDVDGDGRMDILHAQGWYQQPESLTGDPVWKLHKSQFGTYGGAEMYAYDVDGDGLNDVITSLAAHDFGLAWFRQIRKDGKITFEKQLIMGDRPSQNKYGVLFTELHSVALADIDGDGLKDIVTGKTYWSHHRKSPLWNTGAVVYWFKLTRDKGKVDWIPYQADTQAGIGRQVIVADINGDNLPDILSGGMKGAHVLTHNKLQVTRAVWESAKPKLVDLTAEEAAFKKGPPAKIDLASGRVTNAIEGEMLKVISATGGKPGKQAMGGFKADKWSDNAQLFWPAGEVGATLVLELPLKHDGIYQLDMVLTRAKDFGIVKVTIDGKVLAEQLDLFESSNVVTTGVLSYKNIKLTEGSHQLKFEIIGANRSAVPKYFMGLDFVKLVKAK